MLPAVVLLPLIAYAMIAGERLLPLPGQAPARIEAVGRQWTWTFRYPDHGAAETRGVLHMPAGAPVDILVSSQDVIHAFWIPRLAGKIDAVPGHVNRLRIQADQPGRYAGQCSEFCGLDHAGMRFDVIVHPAGGILRGACAGSSIRRVAEKMSESADQLPQGTPALRLHRQLSAIWATGPGIQRLAAVNHSVIGIRMMVTSFVFFAIAGVLGMLTRVQLATPNSGFMVPETYNQVFTMHGSMMLFLFAIPMVESFAVYLTPKILGTRDFAFPRLTAYGYWCYLFGGTILTVALIAGVAPNSGWFMYTPLSSIAYTPGINSDVWLLGVTFVEISALSLAVEIVVSILKMRAPGMSLDRMPIFAWYILVTAMMMIVAFPPLILGSILLEVERAFGLPFFDPTRGGDALLWQHLFWLFGHPDVYIIFLPMAGVLSTIIPVFANRELVGYRAIVVAIIALAFLSFGIWVHHMFTVGIPHLALAFFSLGSAIVAVPTAVQIFAWLATLAHGRPRWDVPMLYVFGFFFIFVMGGLTGVMLAMVPFDWQAHDTYFVVAHMHYVVAGALAFPMLAALYYWLPLLTGRTAVHRLSVPAFWLVFIGFNMTFFMMHLIGLRGMPRRIHTYSGDEGWNWLNLLSSVGGFVMTIGFALVVIDLVVQLRYGRRVRRNPWGATTLEWAMPMPPAPYAFASIPDVGAPGPTEIAPGDLAPSLARGEGYLGSTRNGWQEALGVHKTSRRAGPTDRVAAPDLPPALHRARHRGGGSGHAVQVLSAVARLCAADRRPVRVRRAERRPRARLRSFACRPRRQRAAAYRGADAPAWLALICALIADGTLFTSLLFGTFYLWIAAPNWTRGNQTRAGPGARRRHVRGGF